MTQDRRALPLCILGAVLPDLLDKSLALIVPAVLGSGRTIGHTLLFSAIAVTAGIFLYYYRHTLLGIAVACAVFSHQILDAMWTIPPAWFYPFRGPFPASIITDYVGHYFWLEITNPSEWVFAWGSIIIAGTWYVSRQESCITFLTDGRKTTIRFIMAFLLGVMGVYLLVFGIGGIPHAIFSPTYDPVTDVMAGLVALWGTIVLVTWPGKGPCSGK